MKVIEKKKVIQEFANKHKVVFEEKGEVGFGRECVGLMHGDNYIDYNPCSFPNYDSIKEHYSDMFYKIAPPDAYHKHDCIAILGQGEEAISKLYDWVVELDKLNVELVRYETGATGMQAVMSGIFGHAFVIKESS